MLYFSEESKIFYIDNRYPSGAHEFIPGFSGVNVARF